MIDDLLRNIGSLPLGDIPEFSTKLKSIYMYLKNMKLYIDDISKGSIVFHLSIYDPYALMNLWEIHSSGELINDLAKLIIPVNLQEDFVKEWKTVVDSEEYESALRRLNERVHYDSFYGIISDDIEWESQIVVDLTQRRPDLKFNILKHWRLSRPETINDLIARSRKVIIAFSPKPLTEYSKYAAHSVVVKMLEAKILDDAKIIPVKISENFVVPPMFESFTFISASEENFVDKVLQDLVECEETESVTPDVPSPTALEGTSEELSSDEHKTHLVGTSETLPGRSEELSSDKHETQLVGPSENSFNMASLTGMLLDVSGSMAENAGEIEQEGGEWVNSVFHVMDNLIKHNLSSEHKVFAVGVGAMFKSGLFDVLRTIEPFKHISSRSKVSYGVILNGIFSILERNGASQIRKWADTNTVKSVVSHEMASAVFDKLQAESRFAKKVAQECLPDACRDWTVPVRGHLGNALSTVFSRIYASTVTTFKQATKKDIEEVQDKIFSLMMKDVESESILPAKKASTIINGCIDDRKQLDSQRIKELKEIVRPFIYGDTPLFKALRQAMPLLRNAKYRNKLLFIISDGMPTDRGDIETIKGELKEAGVTVVSCYITRSQNIDPRHLFNKSDQLWEDGAQFLFNLSSTITTQSLPRTVFIKQGWKVDFENNNTRLFLLVNHPKHINEVCDLARNVVCSGEVLSNMLTSVSLDIYINQSTTGFKAQEKQVGGTCYANASAAVLHLSLKSIPGRYGGYPEFKTLRDEMVSLHGSDGAVTYDVFKSICSKYRLHCKQVDVDGAKKAITANRPVVAIFCLTKSEWDIFSKFYKNNRTGILGKNKLDIQKRSGDQKLDGHAVVLTSFNSECLYLMNSWGDSWGDMGFFRVQSANVLDLKFIDVYWTLNDLFDSEKQYFIKYGHQRAADLIGKLQGLQQARYTCPLCETESFVAEFTGTLSSATCPSCEGSFECGESGNILALNMYLLSLTR
ncbi:uncharacterized protein LOC117121023 isoform X2 [Anneissia japonica]|uniref:uncharacterized protein LOC117121023 isoform X2 n=1 Tax=Anneissia japonica TaxID=1529436 RepID=UPI0014256B87|nr:uncharacterized protein LOC117121023 isoform X2 [Anneissia japonica]